MPAGYSGTPLAKKLGIVAGKSQRVLLVRAPKGFEAVLGEVPADALVTRRASKSAPDVILAFLLSESDLENTLGDFAHVCTASQRLWLCWPKKASGVLTPLSEASVRAAGLNAALVDIKVCAVDETWSGLCFVRRVRDRS